MKIKNDNYNNNNVGTSQCLVPALFPSENK